MRMIDKGQVEGVNSKDVLGEKNFIDSLSLELLCKRLDNHRVILSFKIFCDTTKLVLAGLMEKSIGGFFNLLSHRRDFINVAASKLRINFCNYKIIKSSQEFQIFRF